MEEAGEHDPGPTDHPPPKTGNAPLAPDSPVHVAVAADLAQASMAKNTRRAYEQALRGFERSGRPETDAGIAAYLGELYDHGRSAACAAMLVAALRFRAVCRGGPVAVRTPEREGHPSRHRPPRPGRRGGRAGRRTQPARGKCAEPGHRRGLPGRDAPRRRWQSPVMPGRYTQGQLAKQGAPAAPPTMAPALR